MKRIVIPAFIVAACSLTACQAQTDSTAKDSAKEETIGQKLDSAIDKTSKKTAELKDSTANFLDRTGDKIKDGAHTIKEDLKEAADTTGNALKRAANKTKDAVSSAAEKTKKAVKKAAEKTAEKVEEGAKATKEKLKD